ncbi:MAG TPA: NapC/NirT family cytochrome c [Usitatibacter sp.]|jgi:cytochrome c-type protein NapC|nr:NapC/NirT family cytochrome c [Usitatibacter sp.]
MIGFWQHLRSRYPSRARAFIAFGSIVLLFVIVGVVLVIGGAAGLAWTETLSFCTGCHEMRDNVYAEYKGTIHDQNRAGVRAICSDCHVPREPVALIKRKMAATFELVGHFRGVIDTKEKFEKERTELAHHVWKRMKETDSLECRNCHDAAHMDPALQSAGAQAKHALMKTQGKTCIDCHYGIAHTEPKGPTPEELYPSLKAKQVKESDAPAT